MEDNKCRNILREGITWSQVSTRRTGHSIPTSLPYGEDSNPIFSVTSKMEPEKVREGRGVVSMTDSGRRYITPVTLSGHLSRCTVP